MFGAATSGRGLEGLRDGSSRLQWRLRVWLELGAMTETVHKHLTHLEPVTDAPLVFFTVCTLNRRPILANEVIHGILRDVWQKSGKLNGWHVGRYVVMPDHVHLFARPEWRAMGMGRWLQVWKSVTSKQIATAMAWIGPVWQKDYFDRYVRSMESYAEKWEYVRMNPARAGLVVNIEDWLFQGEIESLGI